MCCWGQRKPRSNRRSAVPTHMTSSWACRTATTPMWSSEACRFRGQKQRLTIARAFLKDPPILIFDEVASPAKNASSSVLGPQPSKADHVSQDRAAPVADQRRWIVPQRRRSNDCQPNRPKHQRSVAPIRPSAEFKDSRNQQKSRPAKHR